MSLSLSLRTGPLKFAAVAMVGLGLFAAIADARPGRNTSAGSRGERTFSAPPPTATAPGAAAPMQKSITQPGQIAKAPAATAAAAQTAQRPSMMRNLLLGGLMGAGLAMLFGTGALASVLGFVLQTLLIVGLVYLAVMAFMAYRNRNASPAPAVASAGAGSRGPQPQNMVQRQGLGMGGGALPPLQLADADFSTFERLLGDIQTTYGRADVDALGRLMTPEMLSYFAHELEDNRRKGVRNELSAPKLLQGDLSEAWREAGSEFATVAMRYSLADAMIDVASGKVVSGSRTPEEVTEIWTFRRDPNAGPQGWELSAIQQTA